MLSHDTGHILVGFGEKTVEWQTVMQEINSQAARNCTWTRRSALTSDRAG
jgi:hypothetical protein